MKPTWNSIQRRSRCDWACAAALAILLIGTRPAPGAEKPNAPSKKEFTAYQIIIERNIFNPNRRPGVKEDDTPRVVARPVRTEAFSLVGTMIDDQQAFAFFDGSDSKYQVVLKPNSLIAGYRIHEIGINCVKLEYNTNQIELPIGMQMRRPGTGEWQLFDGAAASDGRGISAMRGRDFGNRGADFGNRGRNPGGRNRGPRSSPAGTNAAGGTDALVAADAAAETEGDAPADASASTGGPTDDVLKKLMEKREKELQK